MKGKVVDELKQNAIQTEIDAIKADTVTVNYELNQLLGLFTQSKSEVDYVKFGMMLYKACTDTTNLAKIIHSAERIGNIVADCDDVELGAPAEDEPAPERPKYIGED